VGRAVPAESLRATRRAEPALRRRAAVAAEGGGKYPPRDGEAAGGGHERKSSQWPNAMSLRIDRPGDDLRRNIDDNQDGNHEGADHPQRRAVGAAINLHRIARKIGDVKPEVVERANLAEPDARCREAD